MAGTAKRPGEGVAKAGLFAIKIDQHDGLVTVAHTAKYLKGAATPAKPFPHSHQAASQFTNAVELS